jgi:ATP-dependent Clp protease protease subunit
MAALILTAGSPGKRLTLPNGRMLIHQPTGGFQGQSSDIEIHARETLALRARLDELYAQHTGKSPQQIHDDSDRDRFMTPEEAVAYGLVDKIVNGRG